MSLTVTEKGYCHDPATGRLNFAHPDIVARSRAPRVAGERRRACSSRRSPRGARHGAGAAHRRLLRQPSAQRPHGRRRRRCVRAGARSRARRLDRRERGVSVDDGRPHRAGDDATPTSPRRATARRGRCGARRRRAVQAMGDRGPLRRARARMGGRRRAVRRRRRAVRDDEAAAARTAATRRSPTSASLPATSSSGRRRRDRLLATLDRAPDDGGDRAHARRAAGVDLAAYCDAAADALPQSGAAAPHAADRDGRLAEAAAAAARARCASGSPPARRSRISRSPSPGWIRYASGVDEQGGAIAVADPLARDVRARSRSAAASDAAAIAEGFLDLAAVFGADLAATSRSAPR